MNTKVVVFGLSTEGYELACKIALNGGDVQIIDESTPSAVIIKPDIAKTYPNVQTLKDDEPLLPMIPIDVAVSKAQILFFAPRIRKTGQDIKTIQKDTNRDNFMSSKIALEYGLVDEIIHSKK